MALISDKQPATLQMATSIGLTVEEYHHICKRLERTPNYAELGVFSAMFSEHCSYKSSKRYLKKLPTRGSHVLQGPGENAGILDIGEGWAVAFKMESHNHPSFIEPYQGAATGVGGILRDIFTMGARPIASMNGLCFGNSELTLTRRIAKGVVKGIGDYGNSVGVPTVAGQTLFHRCYNGNPLVNAFTLGIVKHSDIFKGYASGIGNAVVYVGAKTGRDGVHGATMASREFSTEKELDRPAVQVGDPFTEKLLLEAALEAMQAGLVVGIQDMGAAGLTSSSFEMAERAGTGLVIDLDKIPTRESKMTAYELLLSESQERMLLVTEPKHLDPLKKVFSKWDLHAEVVGTVIEEKKIQMTHNGELVLNLPVEMVANPPLPEHNPTEPSDFKQRWFIDRNRLLLSNFEEKLKAVIGDANFANASPIAEQYDSMVGNRTEGETFDDGAVLRLREIEGSTKKIALTTDCNPRICWLWPKEGGRRAVSEAAINLAVRGAKPIGVTDCLNFGSPENAEVIWQFSECIDGIAQACEVLDTPVISGNVSFYNDTDGNPIYPTPMIGMAGLIEHDHPLPKSYFYEPELEIGLLGKPDADLGGSVLASRWFQRDCGKPSQTDLNQVRRIISYCLKLNQRKIAHAAHDVSDGGLITALLEMAFHSPIEGIGFDLHVPDVEEVDSYLFGESIPRVLLAFPQSSKIDIETLVGELGLSFASIGKTQLEGKVKISHRRAMLTTQTLSDLKADWKTKWEKIFR